MRFSGNSDIFTKKQISDTATGKILDSQNVYDALQPVFRAYSDMWEHKIDVISLITDLNNKLIRSFTFNKDAKLKSNGVRAGSTLTTGTALKRLIDFTGAEMEDVLPLLTMNPAKLLGVDDKIGSLEAGKDVDILIVDEGYNIVDTFVKGKKIER